MEDQSSRESGGLGLIVFPMAGGLVIAGAYLLSLTFGDWRRHAAIGQFWAGPFDSRLTAWAVTISVAGLLLGSILATIPSISGRRLNVSALLLTAVVGFVLGIGLASLVITVDYASAGSFDPREFPGNGYHLYNLPGPMEWFVREVPIWLLLLAGFAAIAAVCVWLVRSASRTSRTGVLITALVLASASLGMAAAAWKFGEVATVIRVSEYYSEDQMPDGGRSERFVPSHVAISPSGSTAYVTGYTTAMIDRDPHEEETLAVVDLDSNTVATTIQIDDRAFSLYPLSIAITPDGRSAYVTDGAGETVGDGGKHSHMTGDTVSVVDLTSNTLTTTVSVGHTATGVAIAPDGRTVFVTERGEIAISLDGRSAYTTRIGAVSIIDTASNTVTTTIPTPDADNQKDLSVVDLDSNTVTTTIPLPLGFSTGVAVAPDGRTGYVPLADGTLAVIDTSSHTVTNTIQFVNDPDSLKYQAPNWVIAITPDGRTAYVIDAYGFDTFYEIDLTSNTVTTLELGPWMESVAITPDGRTAYFVDRDNQSLISLEIGD